MKGSSSNSFSKKQLAGQPAISMEFEDFKVKASFNLILLGKQRVLPWAPLLSKTLTQSPPQMLSSPSLGMVHAHVSFLGTFAAPKPR